MEKNTSKYDWIIHLVSNDAPCACCGKTENKFPVYICNAHTHGMERYNHLDFQIVLDIPAEDVGYLLNTMGERVRAGEKFKDGDVVKGLFLDCDVRLMRIKETGRDVLRLIIPDSRNRFPGDAGCKYPYSQQTKIF